MSNYAPAVDWAIRLIEILAGSDDALGITDLSRLAGINKNMVYRALNSLEAAGWVFCENPSEKKYRLTLRPFHMARKAADRLSICPVAEPYLHALWKRHGESTYLGILREGRVLCIRHYDSIQDVKVAGTLGGSYELYCSAPGKILLAYMPEDALAAYLAHPRKKRTEHTITEYDVLMAELEKTGKPREQHDPLISEIIHQFYLHFPPQFFLSLQKKQVLPRKQTLSF